MKKGNRRWMRWAPFSWVILMCIAHGCSHEIRKPSNLMDTPGHHVYTGMRLLEEGLLANATREFDLALELDPEHSPAFQGKGIVLAMQGDFKRGFDAMGYAKKHAKGGREKGMAHVGYMQVYTMEKGKGWLKKVEDHYKDAMSAGGTTPDACFAMGMAFKEDFQLEKAAVQFRRVLSLDGGLVTRADDQLRQVQKIQRAIPGTEIGKRMAFREKVTRAEVSALLLHELRIDRFLKKKEGQGDPGRGVPGDVKDHPLRADIELILALGIRGLDVYPDHTFRPDAPLARAMHAMAVEDLLAAITNDRHLSTAFLDSISPFQDVRSDAPFFNAIMVCLSRGLMEPADARLPRFNPGGPVSGADVLLAIRKLKEELRAL